MRAPSCGSVDLRPTLSSLSDGSGLRIFSVQSSSAAIPTSSPLAILSVGRTKDACPAHLSVGSASACANGAVRQGGANSPGAQQWVLEDAGKSAAGAQLVYIYSAVGGHMRSLLIGTCLWPPQNSAEHRTEPVHLAAMRE
jgi:hypothetical protein